MGKDFASERSQKVSTFNGKNISSKVSAKSNCFDENEKSKMNAIWAIASLTVFPVILLAVQVSCSKGKCTVFEIPPFPSDLKSYVNVDSLGVYFGWMTFQFILFILPIGSKVQRKSSNGKLTTCRLNGPFACLITYVSIFVSIYWGYSYEVVTKNLLSLHIISIVSSFLLAAVICFTNTTKDRSKSLFLRFANGSESQPKLWSFDVKRFLLRTSLLSWGALCFAIQGADHASPRGLHPSNTLVTLIHVYLAGEAVCLEESLLSTLLVRHDSVGFQFIYGCLTAVPILFTTTLRYTSDQNLPMSELAVVSRFFLSVPGYCLYRGSLSDKASFTQDPDDEDFSESYVIRDNKGSAILAEGFWAYSRNPNYLGCLILALTWLSPGYDGFYKSICVLVVAVYLLNRSFTVDRVNQRLFGGIWAAYCQKVKYRIMKNVF